MNVTRRAVFAVFFWIFFAIFAVRRAGAEEAAPEPAAAAAPEDDLLFKIAIMGPSDEVYIWWGHAALIVENTRYNYARIFDWGIFNYPSDNFLWDFVNNRVRYNCRVGPYDLREYFDEDRDIVVYTLDLSAAGKKAILDYAENAVLPENCYYDYHEFRNNCSTGIRDVIDIGTEGRLKAVTQQMPGRFSLRSHIRRFAWHNAIADWFFEFLMGQTLDDPVNVWDEMFLPSEIAREISEFKLTGKDGLERPLVIHREILNSTKTRNPIVQRPMKLFLPSLGWGLAAAFFLALVKKFRKSFPRIGRAVWGLCNVAAGVVLGGIGTILFYGRYLLNYDYIRQNGNLLFINPLLLLALPLGIAACFGAGVTVRGKVIAAEKVLRILWAYVFAAGFLVLAARVFPFYYQHNMAILALVLPPAFVLGGMSALCKKLIAYAKDVFKQKAHAE